MNIPIISYLTVVHTVSHADFTNLVYVCVCVVEEL